MHADNKWYRLIIGTRLSDCEIGTYLAFTIRNKHLVCTTVQQMNTDTGNHRPVDPQKSSEKEYKQFEREREREREKKNKENAYVYTGNHRRVDLQRSTQKEYE